MTRIITLLTIIVLALIGKLNAQEVVGHWTGKLEIPGNPLTVNFHISSSENGLITTMDSPDQGAMGIETSSSSFEENVLVITLNPMQIKYTANLNADALEGTFTQAGNDIPLTMKRSSLEDTAEIARPQDPKKPFPYKVEEVKFPNPLANHIQLAGTLTLPKLGTPSAAVVLISGSGPQNRDEELFNHRPFLVWADYLTQQGIAVLRYDDRGVSESEGTQKGATSADFATDVAAAVAYLRTRSDIDGSKIGVMGHSEGGFIAPMVSAKDKSIAFTVLLAGTGVDGEEVLASQTRRHGELEGTSKELLDLNEKLLREICRMVKAEKDESNLENKIKDYLKSYIANNPNSPIASSLTEENIEGQASTFEDPWIAYFIKTDPQQFLSKVSSPVLAINGSKDFQVLPELNLPTIEKALTDGGNRDVTIHEFEGLNHLFQTCNTGAGNEYAQIEETIAPPVLELVTKWILAKTK